MLYGISGPSATGKSTLVSLIESSLPEGSVIVQDLHDTIFADILSLVEFFEFKEIAKDKDYLLVYYSKLVKYYVDIINEFKESKNIVVIDGTHLDILIYGMLNFWYHYPVVDIQEKLVTDLLDTGNVFDAIYMTVADDDNFQLNKLNSRRYYSSFRKNRKLELGYYNVYRGINNVVTLPSPSVLECDKFIVQDILSRNPHIK